MPVKGILSILLLLLSAVVSKAQSSSLFEETDLYLHLDKTVYTNGENIWFTGYALNNGFDTTDRQILYVLLIDPLTRKTVLSDRFPLSDGVGKGNLFLPDSLQRGDYSIVAYTNAFLRGSGERPFIGNIVLGSSRKMLPAKDSMIRIAYFPEGGSLVRDRVCKMDLQVMGERIGDRSYHGILFSGQDSVSEFQTDQWGRGTLYFQPETDGRYRVVLDSIDPKRQAAQDFPKVLSSGYSLQLVRLSSDGLRVGIRSSDSLATCLLRVQKGALLLYSGKLAFGKEGGLADIDTRNFPQGLARVCLLNKDSVVVASRDLYFPGPAITCSISADSLAYHTRSRARVHVHLGKSFGNGQRVVFSLAVVHSGQLNTTRFIDISKGTDPVADRIQPVNPWERFPLPKKAGALYEEDDYGSLLHRGRQLKRPAQLILTGENFALIPTDSSGEFSLPPNVLLTKTSEKIGVSIAGKDPENYTILLANRYDSVNSELARFIHPVVFVASPLTTEREINRVQGASTAKLLQTVTVRAERKTPLTRAFRGLDGEFHSTNCRDWVCRENILNCRDHDRRERGSYTPIEGDAYLFQARDGGEYRIVTYHGCVVKKWESSVPVTKVAALHLGKSFYTSDYSKYNPTEPQTATTVFWSPVNSPDAEGNFDFSFYTNDLSGEFSIVLEGVTERGVISARKEFTVNR